MKTYCIQETNLSNGAKNIITKNFRNDMKAFEILVKKMTRYIVDKAEITEYGRDYFCCRDSQGIEMMFAVIER